MGFSFLVCRQRLPISKVHKIPSIKTPFSLSTSFSFDEVDKYLTFSDKGWTCFLLETTLRHFPESTSLSANKVSVVELLGSRGSGYLHILFDQGD